LGLRAPLAEGAGGSPVSLVVVTPDDVITLFDGSEYRVLERPSGPGDAIITEFRLPDGCAEPLIRVHPHNIEVFEILECAVEFLQPAGVR
jgi:hypothetical protein